MTRRSQSCCLPEVHRVDVPLLSAPARSSCSTHELLCRGKPGVPPRGYDSPVLVRFDCTVQPAGVLELNGRRVSKLRQDCRWRGEQRCSHLRATHGARVDSEPVLMVPTAIRSEPYIDAPDLDR